jgi:hypothetical protein
MSLQLAIFESRTGPMLADWTEYASDVELSTNEHGFATLSALLQVAEHETFVWFDRPGLPWIEINSNGETSWRGRLEDVRLVDGGIQVTALGAWSAFGDIPYTATPASPTTADVIVEDILAAVIAANPAALSDSELLIQAPGVNVYDEEYTDDDMRTILTRLTTLGDSQTPPRHWEIGVWEDDRLFFRPRGSEARAYYADAASLEIERSLSQVWNSAYTRYNSGASTTATASDTPSIARYGLTRRQAVSSRTTDATQAARERDAALEDGATLTPRASVVVDTLRDGTGAVVPLWGVRSGDTLTIRNLPPTLSSTIDRIRTFRISETRYRPGDDLLEITPESPPPMLDVLVARSLEVPE